MGFEFQVIVAAPSTHNAMAIVYSVSDGHGGSVTDQAGSIVDLAPNATTHAFTLTAAATLSGTLVDTDGDFGVNPVGTKFPTDPLTITAVDGVAGNVGKSIAGTYGHLTLNTGHGLPSDFNYLPPTYSSVAHLTSAIAAPPAGSDPVDTFTYTVWDGFIDGRTGLPITATETLTFTITQPTTPAVTAIAESPASGEVGTGAKVIFTLTTNEPVTVDTTNGAPTLDLNDNGVATYDAAASTGTSLVFDYTLSGTDIANVTSLQATLFNLNHAVIANGAITAVDISLAGLSQSGPKIDLPQLTRGFAVPLPGTYRARATTGLFF